ncbi:MAG: hypothetical protein WBV96_22305 [Polyangia bacterium]
MRLRGLVADVLGDPDFRYHVGEVCDAGSRIQGVIPVPDTTARLLWGRLLPRRCPLGLLGSPSPKNAEHHGHCG